jgi:hypothetical protein
VRRWNENERRAPACFYCLAPVEIGEGHCWGGRATAPTEIVGERKPLPKRSRRRSHVAHKACLVQRWAKKTWLLGDEDFIAKLEGRTPEVSEVEALFAETTFPGLEPEDLPEAEEVPW